MPKYTSAFLEGLPYIVVIEGERETRDAAKEMTMTKPTSITELVNNPTKAKEVAASAAAAPAKAAAKKSTTKKPAQPKARAKSTPAKAAKGEVAKSPITGRKVTSAWASMTKEQREAKYAYNREKAAAKRAAAKKAAKPAKRAKKSA